MKNIKKVDSKTLHTAMIEEADKAIQGRGDGRISEADAKKIAAHLKTADKELGAATLQHIRENYKVTATAQAHFDGLLASETKDITIDVANTIEWTYESWSGKNFDPATITDYLNKTLSNIHPAYIKIAVDEYLVWKQSGTSYNALIQYYNTTEGGIDGNLRYCPEPSTQQGGNFKNYNSFEAMTKDLKNYKPEYRQIYSHALMRANYNEKYRTWTMIQVEETFEPGKPSENNKYPFLWENKSTTNGGDLESTYQDVSDASPFCVKTCTMGLKENDMQFDIFFNKKMPTAQLDGLLALPYYDFKDKWYWGVHKFSSSDEVLHFLNNDIEPQLSYLCQITAGSGAWPGGNPTNNYYVFYPIDCYEGYKKLPNDINPKNYHPYQDKMIKYQFLNLSDFDLDIYYLTTDSQSWHLMDNIEKYIYQRDNIGVNGSNDGYVTTVFKVTRKDSPSDIIGIYQLIDTPDLYDYTTTILIEPQVEPNQYCIYTENRSYYIMTETKYPKTPIAGNSLHLSEKNGISGNADFYVIRVDDNTYYIKNHNSGFYLNTSATGLIISDTKEVWTITYYKSNTYRLQASNGKYLCANGDKLSLVDTIKDASGFEFYAAWG